MSDLDDALEALARRGTPRGFDDVLASAQESVRAGSGDAAPVERGRGAGDGGLEPIPLVDTQPVVGRPRPPARTIIVAAGLATLLFVGVLAMGAFVGSGGSSSPEGAVRRLADAIKQGDPLAAADVVAPGELRTLHDSVDAAERKAQELNVVTTAGAPLAGVDFDVTGLKLSTQTLADGYAKVTIDAGTISASTHKARFSPLMQKVLRDSHDDSVQHSLANLAASNDLPTFVMAVRDDGKWYVSAAYTLLEYVRAANNLPAADFGSGARDVAKLGAASPDAAVQDAMRALASSDWPKLISLADPSELPVYDYRAALSELARRDRPQTGFTISTLSTRADVNGDTAKVSLQASGTTDGGKWTLDGGCFSYTPDDPESATGFETLQTCDTAYPFFFSLLAFPLSGLAPDSQITVVHQEGRWFVSPGETVLDLVDGTLAKLDRRSLYLMLNVPTEIPPDGALTLGKPVALHGGTPQGFAVLSFAGHEGEQLLGLAKSSAPDDKSAPLDDYSPPASGRVFAPDGSELGDAFGMLAGTPLELPADGTYTVVLQVDGLVRRDVAVTIWDAADAPPEAKVDRGFGGSCNYGILSSECFSTSSGGSVSSGTSYSSGSAATVAPCTPTSDSTGAVICTGRSTTEIIQGATSGQLGVNGVPPGGAAPTTAVGGAVSATAAPHG